MSTAKSADVTADNRNSDDDCQQCFNGDDSSVAGWSSEAGSSGDDSCQKCPAGKYQRDLNPEGPCLACDPGKLSIAQADVDLPSTFTGNPVFTLGCDSCSAGEFVKEESYW